MPSTAEILKKNVTNTGLDQRKAVFMDENDPRASGWPCHSKHIPGQRRANASGEWHECSCCGIRTLYVPKIGYHGKTLATVNHEHVSIAVMVLEGLLQNEKPSSVVVQKAIDVVKAEVIKQKAMSDLQVGIVQCLQHGGAETDAAELNDTMKQKIVDSLIVAMEAHRPGEHEAYAPDPHDVPDPAIES